MRFITFDTPLILLPGIYLSFYYFTAILLLAGTLFKNKIRTESYNLLFVFTTLVAWCHLFLLLSYAVALFTAWYGQNPYEWFGFREPGYSYRRIVLIISLSSLLLGLLFFFRKLRTKRWLILVFLLLQSGFIFEKLVIYVTGLYRDYLPSSWSLARDENYSRYMINYGIIALLLLLVYVWAKKKGTLPYPSVFLK